MGSVVRSGEANAIVVGRRKASVLVNRARSEWKAMVVARATYRKGNDSKKDSMEAVEPCMRRRRQRQRCVSRVPVQPVQKIPF